MPIPALCLFSVGGYGQHRTADLPLFSCKDGCPPGSTPVHLPTSGPYVTVGGLPRTKMNETATETGTCPSPRRVVGRRMNAPPNPCLQSGGWLPLAGLRLHKSSALLVSP
jgi:hypothetical protein